MRTIKTVLLLAVTALVSAAFVAPGIAAAWQKEGAGIYNPHWTSEGKELTESSSFGIEGAFDLTSSAGGFACSLSAAGTLSPGASGSLAKFQLSNCTLSGGLQNLCGKVGSVTTGTMSVQTNGSTITIPNFEATYNLEKGIFCPKPVTVKGQVTLTPANKGSISTVLLSGELSSSLGPNMHVSGSPTLTPAGKYGIANSETVHVEGSLGYVAPGGLGTLNCTVSADIELDAGNTGKVVSMSVPNPNSDCSLSGVQASACGGAIISVTPSGLPWSVQNTNPTITVSGVSFTVQGQTCTRVFDGTLTLTPNNPNAISSVSVAGTSSNFPTTWTGSWNWSPAGVFGL